MVSAQCSSEHISAFYNPEALKIWYRVNKNNSECIYDKRCLHCSLQFNLVLMLLRERDAQLLFGYLCSELNNGHLLQLNIFLVKINYFYIY